MGGTLEEPWKSGRQGNLCPLEQVRSPRTSAGRSLAGADLVAAAFVTGASKNARALDGLAGRQAPSSLSTSLQNILPILNDELRNELRTSLARVSQRVTLLRFVYK